MFCFVKMPQRLWLLLLIQQLLKAEVVCYSATQQEALSQMLRGRKEAVTQLCLHLRN